MAFNKRAFSTAEEFQTLVDDFMKRAKPLATSYIKLNQLRLEEYSQRELDSIVSIFTSELQSARERASSANSAESFDEDLHKVRVCIQFLEGRDSFSYL